MLDASRHVVTCGLGPLFTHGLMVELYHNFNSITGLGVVINRRETMMQYIKHLKEKAGKSLPMLRYAAAHDIQQKSLVTLMRATVCTKSEYGLHIASGTSESALKSLQSIHNKAMRIVAGAAKPTCCKALRHWMGVPPIRDKQDLASAQAFLKAVTTTSHPLYQHLHDR